MTTELTSRYHINIDDEFQQLCPALSPDEFNLLRSNILAEGCRDPLVIWREEGILLDGHNRLAICEENDIPFQTVELSLPSREAAKDWIIRNQLGRRNLTPTQWTCLLGLRYNIEKKEVPNPEGVNQYDEVEGQNVPQPTTAERLADEYGVSDKTVKRAGQFAEAVEELKPHVPDIQARVMAGKIPSRAAVIKAAREPEKAKEILKPATYPKEKIECDPDSDNIENWIGGYEVHPAALNAFPLMSEPELRELAEDIRINGQLHPVLLYGGKVLDGRNRILACEKLGIKPKVHSLPDTVNPWRAVWSLNGERRNLNEDAWYLIWKKCQYALKAFLSHSDIETIRRMEIIKRECPDLIDPVIRGTMTAEEAELEAKKHQEEQEKNPAARRRKRKSNDELPIRYWK